MSGPRDSRPEEADYEPDYASASPTQSDPATRSDPTTPLQDDSTRIDSAITGPGANGAPAYGTTQQQLAGLAHPKDAPKPNDYTDHYHHLTEDDYQQNQRFAHGKDPAALFSGDISGNDVDRLKFGVEEPAKLKAANDAQTRGKQQLGRYSTAINSGDVEAVGTADQILAQGEPALAFFRFFAPAYNAWKGGGLTYEAAKQAYEAEYGLSFADYLSDAKLLADIGQQLQGSEQTLDNAYNALVPTWHGAAASNFEAKMTMFFTATNTVTSDLAVVSKDIGALVHGLQQLVLAKAQAVSELYAAELPTGIDAVMASSLVKVAMGEGDEQENLIAFKLLSGEPSGFDQFLIDFGLAGEVADRHAPRLATQWCNEILVPQFETREQALKTINSQTRSRIQQGFKEFTSQVSQVRDPYTGMHRVGVGGGAVGSGGVPGGGIPGGGGIPAGGGAGGGGAPSVQLPNVAAAGATIPAAAGGTTPQGAPNLPNLPTGGTGTGTGGPGGLPGADPTAGLSTLPAAIAGIGGGLGGGTAGSDGSAGAGALGNLGGPGGGPHPSGGIPAGVGPAHDIHKNPDGSVTLGSDRGLTISRERGKKGVFTLSNTGPDGVQHTYRVHFDEHGNPVVTEERAHGPGVGDPLAAVTSPAGDLGGGSGGIGGIRGGGGVSGGFGAGGLPGGVGVSTPAAHGGDQLRDGTHVGADNTTVSTTDSTTNAGTDNATSASGAAGSAAATAGPAAPGQPQGGGEHGGAVGGIPFAGGARGGAGGGEQESARRYPQRGDIVGEDELEEWQRMGPVIGEP